MPTPTIEDILACQALPSLPSVALEVLELARDAEIDLRRISATLQNDPALTARILRTVNSSYYPLSRPCSTILRAMSYLGLNTVKALMLGFSLVDMTRASQGFDFMSFWVRTLRTASAARRLAALQCGCDAEEAFTAALLQDIGMLAMETAMPRAYGAIVAEAGADHAALAEHEGHVLGFDHAEVGGRLAHMWRLPDGICTAIAGHHDADGVGEGEQLARIVQASSGIAAALGAENPCRAIRRMHDQLSRWFGLDPGALPPLFARIMEDVEQLGALFAVPTGDSVAVQRLLVTAQDVAATQQANVDRDIETLRSENLVLHDEARTDSLTRLPNRREFDAMLVRRFDQTVAFNGSLGLLIVDVDHFKRINDGFGHPAGDQVLQGVAERLVAALRDRDLAARIGGEEFAVLVPGCSADELTAIAERLRTTIASTRFMVADLDERESIHAVEVTASIGAAVVNAESVDVISSQDLLLAAADRALYAAKQGGRNCVRIYRVHGRAARAG